MRTQIIIHERIGKWAAQIRPRVATWPVRVYETRSMADLDAVVRLTPCPILVVDTARDCRLAMDHAAQARRLSPDSLILAVQTPKFAEFDVLARELGATHCLPVPVVPPHLMTWLERWLNLAQRRNAQAGWSAGLSEPITSRSVL